MAASGVSASLPYGKAVPERRGTGSRPPPTPVSATRSGRPRRRGESISSSWSRSSRRISSSWRAPNWVSSTSDSRSLMIGARQALTAWRGHTQTLADASRTVPLRVNVPRATSPDDSLYEGTRVGSGAQKATEAVHKKSSAGSWRKEIQMVRQSSPRHVRHCPCVSAPCS